MKRKLLNQCLNIALKNNTPIKHPQWKCYHHFSFIIQKNKIVDWGTNRESPPLTYLGYDTYTKMHSEVDAYFKAKGIMDKREDFEVVNIRLTNTHSIRESAPCKCCFAFLENLGCKKVWFTTEIGKFASVILNC